MATREEEVYVNQPTAAPTNKVVAGGIGGAVATVIVVLLQMTMNIQFPPGFEAAIATIVAVIAAYVTKNKVQVEEMK